MLLLSLQSENAIPIKRNSVFSVKNTIPLFNTSVFHSRFHYVLTDMHKILSEMSSFIVLKQKTICKLKMYCEATV